MTTLLTALLLALTACGSTSMTTAEDTVPETKSVTATGQAETEGIKETDTSAAMAEKDVVETTATPIATTGPSVEPAASHVPTEEPAATEKPGSDDNGAPAQTQAPAPVTARPTEAPATSEPAQVPAGTDTPSEPAQPAATSPAPAEVPAPTPEPTTAPAPAVCQHEFGGNFHMDMDYSRQNECMYKWASYATCAKCGQEYMIESADWKVSHSFGRPDQVVYPTCTKEGYQHWTCSICGEEQSMVMSTTIDNCKLEQKEVIVTEPGCYNKPGKCNIIKKCPECGREEVTEGVDYGDDCHNHFDSNYRCTICGTDYSEYYKDYEDYLNNGGAPVFDTDNGLPGGTPNETPDGTADEPTGGTSE